MLIQCSAYLSALLSYLMNNAERTYRYVLPVMVMHHITVCRSAPSDHGPVPVTLRATIVTQLFLIDVCLCLHYRILFQLQFFSVALVRFSHHYIYICTTVNAGLKTISTNCKT